MIINSYKLSWLCLSLASALLLYLYIPVVSEVAIICWNDDNYSHGLLLPFISLWLAWGMRAKISSALSQGSECKRRTPSLLGIVLLTAGLLTGILGSSSELLFISWTSLFPTLLGTICLFFGTHVGVLLAPVILLIFLAKPFPDVLAVRLFANFQSLAAKTSSRILEVIGIPVHLAGNVIEIPGLRLLVEEACSGMRSVMVLLTVAIVVTYIVKNRWPIQFMLVVLSIVLALFFNVLRVTLTGIVAYKANPEIASGFLHSFSGIVTFLIGFCILYYLASRFHTNTHNS